MVEGIKSDLTVTGTDLDVLKRPESATSGELSSLNTSLERSNLEANVGDQQSPARSPHARSWTVPGV